jgi:hypothetical protein
MRPIRISCSSLEAILTSPGDPRPVGMKPMPTAEATLMKKSCHDCMHLRRRVLPQLHLGAVTSETLKVRSEWNTEWKRREQDEYHRFCAGEPFFEEPFFYTWCHLFSGNTAQQNRLTDCEGRVFTEYTLCARQNPDADCAWHCLPQAEP